MDTSRLARRSVIAGVGITALAACSSGKGSTEATDTDEAPPSEEAAPDASAIAEEVPLKEGEALVEIGEEFEDPVMGDAITVHSAIRNVVSDEAADLTEDDAEVVYLLVSVTLGDEYGHEVYDSDFSVPGNGDNYSGDLGPELQASGREVLVTGSQTVGDEVTGWAPIFVADRAPEYTAAFARPESKVLGSDDVVEGFTHEFTIPAA